MTLHYRGTVYDISVENPQGASRGVSAVEIDGVAEPVSGGKAVLKLRDDQAAHRIRIVMGPPPERT
jgi:cyclic beta-1,2-glucan synthetase